MNLHLEDWLLIGCAAVCAAGALIAWAIRPGGWLDRRIDDAWATT